MNFVVATANHEMAPAHCVGVLATSQPRRVTENSVACMTAETATTLPQPAVDDNDLAEAEFAFHSLREKRLPAHHHFFLPRRLKICEAGERTGFLDG